MIFIVIRQYTLDELAFVRYHKCAIKFYNVHMQYKNVCAIYTQN